MAVQNSEEIEDSVDMSKTNELIHSISSQYREKYTDCGKYLNELRLLKQDLLEKETVLMANVESSYDKYIRQIKNQKEQCMSAISEEYSHRTKHVDKLIETMEQMQTLLSEYTVMSTSQDTFSDTESVGSAVFSDIESVNSEVTSPLCEPPRVEREILSYNECKVVFGENGVKQGEFRNLRGLAVDYQNRIFVVDCGNKRVQVFDEDTKFLFEFGSLGNEDGQFLFPYGVAINGHTIYITDSERHNIQAFDLSGTFLYKSGVRGGGTLQFNAPCGLAVSEDGRVFIADSVNNRIQVRHTHICY
eukprot:TRINITY_DN8011_c0_g1_i1.p1 TRINITY_DN8011_c0_g1~~TRINITY_DN8011_c0_g1_i1.p1  ORF type:complete len:303 (-),score=57.05 TRINITY_DN8011_c0_g1_i1:38-946(-)